MTASGAAAYGMFPRNVALPEIVHTLNRAGFGNQEICMVLSPAHPVAAVVRETNILNAEREASAISTGMIRWFSEFGAVVIPSVGFFIRSPAFFHALVTEQKNSSALCGGSKTLAGLGFSDADAERLGDQLGQVGVLIYVLCQEKAKTDWAIDLLRRTGAGEAAILGEARGREKAAGAVA